jgi:hypothetical protein
VWWVPATVVCYFIYTWLAKQNNELGGKWFWIMYAYAVAICPLVWLVVSRISKNLLFDGMLFDNLLSLTYIITMIYLGAHAKLVFHQWIGIGLVIVGFILMRWEI